MYRPIGPHELPATIADWLLEATPDRQRVAVDGAVAAQPELLAAAIVERLHAAGRAAAVVPASSFWKDASLRLEYGHTDIHAYLHDWLDTSSLNREVLEPLEPGGTGHYLPSLRDPVTNRATREPVRAAAAGEIVLVAGTFLLGRGLPFDRAVHLALGEPALRRRLPEELAWTLPAYADYESGYRPGEYADVTIRLDDPRHPAISWSADR